MSDCFRTRRRSDRRLDKPVMHDDQWAPPPSPRRDPLNACRLTGVDFRPSRVGRPRPGAAGSAIARVAPLYGAQVRMVADVARRRGPPRRARRGRVGHGHRHARGRHRRHHHRPPRPIKPEMVRKGQVIFALPTPDPRSPPTRPVRRRGLRGRRALDQQRAGLPGIFRGALSTSGPARSPRRCSSPQPRAIAAHAPEGELVPNPLDMKAS